MALPEERTLEDLRTEMAARLGMASMGSSGGINRPLIDSCLREAQEWLYERYEFRLLINTWSAEIGQGQVWVDYPDDCNPDRIRQVRVRVDDRSWRPLREGIEYYHDSHVQTQREPLRYEIRSQMEIWPEPDRVYPLRIEGYRRLGRFTQNDDRATLPSRLVFLHALLKGKFHYRQPDAQVLGAELNAMLRTLRGRVHGTKRYVPASSGARRRARGEAIRPIIEGVD